MSAPVSAARKKSRPSGGVALSILVMMISGQIVPVRNHGGDRERRHRRAVLLGELHDGYVSD